MRDTLDNYRADPIYDLACEAGFRYIPAEGMGWTGDCNNLEFFAELIVRECARKLENDGMVEAAIELKQHFGILEK